MNGTVAQALSSLHLDMRELNRRVIVICMAWDILYLIDALIYGFAWRADSMAVETDDVEDEGDDEMIVTSNTQRSLCIALCLFLPVFS